MTETFKAGDLVSCRDENYFDGLSLKKNSGIILEKKKSTCKVMFDDFSAGYYLAENQLEPVKKEVSSFVREISRLALQLHALSFEFEKGKGTRILSLILEKINLSQIESVKDLFADRLVRLECLPHMMHEMILELEYRE